MSLIVEWDSMLFEKREDVWYSLNWAMPGLYGNAMNKALPVDIASKIDKLALANKLKIFIRDSRVKSESGLCNVVEIKANSEHQNKEKNNSIPVEKAVVRNKVIDKPNKDTKEKAITNKKEQQITKKSKSSGFGIKLF